MRTPDGHIYLIDFGIARHFKPGQAKDTVYYGSMGYAPPEQYGRAQTTPRTDIYSLGATLYQLLSGHDPSSSPFHFPLLQSLLPTIPASLSNLVMQMLELDAGRRPASILLVKQELEALSSAHSGRKTNLPPTIPAPPQYAGPPRYASPPPPQIGRKLAVGTVLLTYNEQASSIAWSSDGKYLASGGGKLVGEGAGPATTVHCWEATTGKTLFILPNHSQWVHPVALSSDGQRLAVGRGDSTVQVRETVTGRQLHLYEGHSDTVYAVAWSPDGSLLASSSRDKTVRVWEVATGKQLHMYTGHSNAALSLAWSPNGVWLASGGGDCKVIVRQVKTGRAKALPIYTGHSNVVSAVTWSPDGRLIASGSWDKTVQVWEADTNRRLYRYEGHSDKVKSVTWSPNGHLVASASWDKTVQVWEATTDRLLYLYRGHANSVNAVAWSPDGERIASGADTVHIWQAP